MPAKKKKIKVAFDLDGVIIDKPPIVPKKLLEWLFRGRKRNGLHYRFPTTKLEQWVRKISHYYLFRPPIEKNLRFVRLLDEKKYDLYVVSSRYSFLKKETDHWLEKRGLKRKFNKIFLNTQDEQPHLFKEKTLKKIKPDYFIDDDNLLADYLTKKIARTKIYCLVNGEETCFTACPIFELEGLSLDRPR